jgi:putative tryptophan/tyrosine transport system substrate-binding protein
MRRRDFVGCLAGAVAWPVAARAQQRMPVIGFLGPDSPALLGERLRAFHQGLGEAGYVDGGNVTIEYRWAENQNDHIPNLVADLLRRRVDVIAAPGSTPATIAAKALTTTVPIVFATGTDPVSSGLVASLNRPGGNLTGVTLLGVEISQKQLELLHEVLPSTTTIALLVNPTNPGIAETTTKELHAAARTLGLELHVLSATSERDFDAVFASLARLPTSGLIIAPDIFFGSRLSQLGALTLQHLVPAIHQFRAFAVAGGLLSYGTNVADAFRRAGVYTGRILKGEKPADLPVERSTKVELVINMKTAKALGLTFPVTLLGRADEVIE